jgi:hypothetical protein
MDAEERFEKIEAAIRDLIVVSRTLLNASEEMHGSISDLRDAQKHTDEKLNALIQAQTESELKLARLEDTVDKIIRYRGPNGQDGGLQT